MSTVKFDTWQKGDGTRTYFGVHTFVVWGTSSNTINSSQNVSSITDNGQADWTINLTSALSNTNYGWMGSGGNDSAAASQTPYLTGKRNVVLSNWKTTSSLRVEGVYSNITNDSNTNLGYFSVGIYGGI